ncbi:MerR family DNA-binding transcriptional regulator [Bradyrhizobium sp. LA6.12]|uniref:MerR family DNA-binding transcriptional regulator n=1 Tax=unclassified Bradyrhizobium TaxID=2631580 RepID=UPI0033968F5A
MKQRTYSIGEAARLCGISVRKLRFYSDEGLLPPADRTASGYRVFTDSELSDWSSSAVSVMPALAWMRSGRSSARSCRLPRL